MKEILCFGDSNTWGADTEHNRRFSYDQRWTGVLENTVGRDRIKVYENGLGGRTAAFSDPIVQCTNGCEYMKETLLTTMPLDLVIIMLGTNDTKTYLGQLPHSLARGLEQLIQIVLTPVWMFHGLEGDKIPQILIVAPPDLRIDDQVIAPCVDLNQARLDRMTEMRKQYREMAEKYHCHFYDAKHLSEFCGYDGVHLTTEGQKRLGLALAEEVKKIFDLE